MPQPGANSTEKQTAAFLQWLDSGLEAPTTAFKRATLSGRDLSWRNLSGVFFNECRLVGTNLVGARLSGARTEGSGLDGAVLWRARLDRRNEKPATIRTTRLRRAMLAGADLTGARLSLSLLTDSDLSEVDLTGAQLFQLDLRGARLSGVDLDRARELSALRIDGETCRRSGWSPDLLGRLYREGKGYIDWTCTVAHAGRVRSEAALCVHDLWAELEHEGELVREVDYPLREGTCGPLRDFVGRAPRAAGGGATAAFERGAHRLGTAEGET